MRDKLSILGHLACFTAYLIFGLNIVVCKELTTSGVISPLALFTLRSMGAGSLFWLISFLRPKERVELRDLPKIFGASVLGFFLAQTVHILLKFHLFVKQMLASFLEFEFSR